jgi:hypothetical protein
MSPRAKGLGKIVAACVATCGLVSERAHAWWDTGHSFITVNTYQQLPPTIQPYFFENQGTITLYAKNEPPGLHFINIDAYPEFHDDGTFPRDLNVLYAKYGTSLVNNRGISPWKIATYRSTLTTQMAVAHTLADWQAIAHTFGEMAHYIEDIHQPLHTTQNYDGQFTGNSGVHARYEGEMINRHFDGLTIAYAPDKTVYIADTVDTVLNSIDVTWRYVSPIMTADTIAAGTPRTFGEPYYDSMWASTGSFTHSQFQLASQMVASLWYSAWVDAGSPAPILNEPTWSLDSDGAWTGSTNWANAMPNGSGAIAAFGSAITSPRTVSITTPRIAGVIKFQNARRYTIAGPAALNISVPSGSGSINVLAGSHTISAPLRLSSNVDISILNAADTLTLSGDMSTTASGLTLTKLGAGQLEVKNLRVETADIEGSSIKVLAGALPNSAGGVSRIRNLLFAGSGTPLTTLDLSNNALVRDYDTTSPIVSTRTFIAKGFHNGAWDGTGITSTSARAALDSGAPRTAIGYAEASTLGITSFFGQTVDGTTVLLQYTLSGDANLDGVVNALDFNALASNFGAGSANLWTQGDFTYDGAVNSLDFNAIATNFARSLPSGNSSMASMVPEPISGAILLLLLAPHRTRSRPK